MGYALNLEELQALIAVVDHGSVLAAADALGLARSTLRRRLDDLEARAGVPLLHRFASGALPTAGGQLLVDQGRRMLREADAVLASVRELGQEASGTVRVVAPPGLAPHLVLPVLLSLRERFPGLVIDLRYDARPLAGFIADVDLAVQFGASLPDGPWVAFVVHRLPERLVAGVQWVAEHGRPERLEDLEGVPIFSWVAPDREANVLPLWGGGGHPVSPAFLSTDIHLVRQLALGGHGVALLPDALLPDPGFGEDALVPILPDLVGRQLAVRVIVPEVLVRVPKIKGLVELLREVAEALPPMEAGA